MTGVWGNRWWGQSQDPTQASNRTSSCTSTHTVIPHTVISVTLTPLYNPLTIPPLSHPLHRTCSNSPALIHLFSDSSSPFAWTGRSNNSNSNMSIAVSSVDSDDSLALPFNLSAPSLTPLPPRTQPPPQSPQQHQSSVLPGHVTTTR